MARAGRAFELLIARIEKQLAPKGAAIKSPDFITDKVTKEPREVDASIRYRVGSSDILITVECRDRNRTEDVRWIEELDSKKKSIGASHTIAVSSKGFSRPAIKKAEALGIDLRTISEITDEDISGFTDGAIVELLVYHSFVSHCEFIPNEQLSPDNGLSQNVNEQLRAKQINGEIFAHKETGETFSIIKFCHWSQSANRKKHKIGEIDPLTVSLSAQAEVILTAGPGVAYLYQGIPVGQDKETRHIWFAFPPDQVTMETKDGFVEVKEFKATLDLWIESRPVPVTKLIEYSDANGIIASVSQREVDLGGKGKFIITSHGITDQQPDTEKKPPNGDGDNECQG